MAEALYREFHIDGRNVNALTLALRAFWVGAVMPFVAKGHRVLMIVTTEEARRNAQQNKRLWGYLYKHIAEQAWVNGKQYNKDVWHEWFARKYGVLEEMVLPDGEIITRRKSTTDMLVGEFAEYMHNIEAEAAMSLGVEFPA